MLETTTPAGLHDFVLAHAAPYLRRQARAVDLGAGSGLLATRLRDAGWDTLAVDINAHDYQADVPFVQANFNDPDFASGLGAGQFALVTSVEVMEHVESPIGFLRNVGRLLMPEGAAILTTPNVDSAPARLKFLLTGTIRMMDAQSEPTHITPVFWDLFVRQYLPRAGVELIEHHVFPPNGYQLTRARYAWFFRLAARVLAGECLRGDNHVLILRKAGGR